MTIYEFKRKAAATSDDTEIDEICFKWLFGVTKDFGEDGLTARELLSIVNRLLGG